MLQNETRICVRKLPEDETGHPENRNRAAPSGFYLKGPFAQKQPVVRRNVFRSYLSADDNRSAILDYRGQH